MSPACSSRPSPRRRSPCGGLDRADSALHDPAFGGGTPPGWWRFPPPRARSSSPLACSWRRPLGCVDAGPACHSLCGSVSCAGEAGLRPVPLCRDRRRSRSRTAGLRGARAGDAPGDRGRHDRALGNVVSGRKPGFQFSSGCLHLIVAPVYGSGPHRLGVPVATAVARRSLRRGVGGLFFSRSPHLRFACCCMYGFRCAHHAVHQRDG